MDEFKGQIQNQNDPKQSSQIIDLKDQISKLESQVN